MTTEEFHIFDRKIIEYLNKLHNDNTVSLNEAFLYRVHGDSTDESMRHDPKPMIAFGFSSAKTVPFFEANSSIDSGRISV